MTKAPAHTTMTATDTLKMVATVMTAIALSTQALASQRTLSMTTVTASLTKEHTRTTMMATV